MATLNLPPKHHFQTIQDLGCILLFSGFWSNATFSKRSSALHSNLVSPLYSLLAPCIFPSLFLLQWITTVSYEYPSRDVFALFKCCTSGEQLLLCVQQSPSASVCCTSVGMVHGGWTITVHTQFSLLTLWIFFLDLNVSQRPLTLTLLPLPQHFPFKFSTTPLPVFHLLSRKPVPHITQY